MFATRYMNLAAIVFFLLTSLLYGQYALPMLLPSGEGFTNLNGEIAGGDFLVFYNAGVMTAKGLAASVWDHAIFETSLREVFGQEIEKLHFFNPPVTLMLWWPFGYLPYFPALWLWTVLPVIALGFAVYRLTGHGLATALTVAAPLVTYNAGGGQSGAFFAAIFGFYAIYLTRRPAMAGSLGGLFVLKPHLAFALPLCLAMERNWRAFVAIGLTALMLIVIATGIFGLGVWFSFLDGVQYHSREVFNVSTPLFDRSPSILLALLKLGAGHNVAWAGQIAGALASLVMCLFIWRNNDDELYRLFALALTICLMTPKVMNYDAVVLLVPIAMLIARLEQGKADKWLVAIAMIIWILPFTEQVFRAIDFNPGAFIFFTGLAMMFARTCRSADHRHEVAVEAL